MADHANIDLYTDNTPNGHKVSCTFEELELKYNLHHVNISKQTQKEEWYLKINPNGRIPAIVDKTGGKEKRVFEGAAIMLYLCAKYDTDHKLSFAYDTDEYWEVVEWLVWMQSGLGPMQGQANHFFRYAPEKIEYGINRYQGETKRLYQVLEDRLTQQEKAGDKLWLVGGWAGVSLDPFPQLKRWHATIESRPAIERGVNVPNKFKIKEVLKDKEAEAAYMKESSSWIMAGQKADQEKHK